MSNNTKRILPRLPVVGGLAALAFLLFVPDTAQAQGPVLFACYVPNSGVVYRVNPPGSPGESDDLKDACTGKKHVLFSWNEVGPAGPPGPAGITPVVFTRDCSAGAFINPFFGSLETGTTITDVRFTISDPPALLTVWEDPAGPPAVLQIVDSFGEYYLEDGRMLLRCSDGDSIVVIVSF